jgi:RNA polymerase sigma factor (sigma-70 family)
MDPIMAFLERRKGLLRDIARKVLRKRGIAWERWDDYIDEIIINGIELMRERDPVYFAEMLTETGPLPSLAISQIFYCCLSVTPRENPRTPRQFSERQEFELTKDTVDGEPVVTSVIQRELRNHVLEALYEELDDRSRAIILAYYYDRRNWKGIAQEWELTPARITQIMEKAYAKLRKGKLRGYAQV